jgi:hypothetical protein
MFAQRPTTPAGHRGARRAALVLAALLAGAPACSDAGPADQADVPGESGVATEVSEVVQTCTAQNVAGWPYSGVVCGGSVIDTCSKGELYTCHGGARGATNNCTLSQSCSTACLTGANDTPVTVNTSGPQASDACFTGTPPLTLASTSVTGGSTVAMTATLAAAHSPYAIVNFQGTSSVVPPLCDVPLLLLPGATQVSWVEPTGVVSTTTSQALNVLISYDDAQGKSRSLVSVPTTLTLAPGGSISVPALASFDLSDGSGTSIASVAGGGNAFARGTLSGPAPVGGVNVTVTSNPGTAFTTDGSFTILTGCTSNSDWGLLTATSALTAPLSAIVTATTGTGAPLGKSITITPPPLAIQSLTLAPSSVTGGGALTATVHLNRVVLSGDPVATASIRLSPGLSSGTQLATFPGCTGSPACTGPITVPIGASTGAVTITTQSIASQDQITVSASADWSNHSASQQLTIQP